MKTTHRNYAEQAGDFNRLCQFITSNNATFRARSTWSLGRIVDWKYSLFANKRACLAFCDQNAHLWFDAFGELAGFAISESGDGGFVILTLDGYRFLYEEMLAWVRENWGGRPGKISTEITEHQEREARILMQYGFTCQETFFSRRFDLTGPLAPRFPLEEGFTIVDMASHPDDYSQGLLRADAFQDNRNPSQAEMDERLLVTRYCCTGPIYHPQTDLCVMAPDGRLVSGCEALIDARNAEADIERVCTHSDFRKRGFARAVIQECLYRLQAMGLHNAYIAGYSQAAIDLYGSLGAVDEVKAFTYKLAPASDSEAAAEPADGA